ncbi:DUF732 domain-containing protein [Mycolicibacter kumamotonensis]|uniref:DUF732 domain-containing protein n=1 Tax=Mycolicibacter kumamotonensis TaxID=354243 RepID=UPI001F1D4702|nr:DUF732 domain-containing protein [Mycolicibacter kumamotonensis]
MRNGYIGEQQYNYLTMLRNSGVSVPLDALAMVQAGMLICNQLRRGIPPTQGIERYFVAVNEPLLISAAQTELCPDTLH